MPLGALIFFCLLFFHQGKKRPLPGQGSLPGTWPACPAPRPPVGAYAICPTFLGGHFRSPTVLTFFRKQISRRRQHLLFFGSEFPVGDSTYFFSEANFPLAIALTFFRKRISCRRQHLLFFGSEFPVGDSTYFFSEANFPLATALTFFRKQISNGTARPPQYLEAVAKSKRPMMFTSAAYFCALQLKIIGTWH